jgi:ligand-binding SRPBCC domain-containing protein
LATIKVETIIQAPIEKCFDASRDIDLHMKSVSQTGEQAVAGKTSGLIGSGETVTWRARHFGITQHFTSKITAFDPPRYFQDTMQKGAFKSFVHDHYFHEKDGQTLMLDILVFRSPLWLLGVIVDALVMKSYMHRLIKKRCQFIKDNAEMPE